MNVREVFCDCCYRWKKREDLVDDRKLKIYVLGAFGSRDCQLIFTEKQLARDGLGHVLYNDAFEVREVEDE